MASYDYYPFGSPAETHESNNGYRYGFNGAEKENQISGKGINYDLGLRFYDSRVARMFSIDPRTPEYPWQSPYVYHRNSPIKTIDYLGGGDKYPTILNKGALHGFINGKKIKLEFVLDLPEIVIETSRFGLLGTRMRLVFDPIIRFINGFGDALKENNTAGIFKRKQATSSAEALGQKYGDGFSLVQGAVETVGGFIMATGGSGGTVITAGVASPVTVPVAATGAAGVVHGAAVGHSAWNNLWKRNYDYMAGKRRKNRLPDKGEPNTSTWNDSGTTAKKYGPDGNLQKEYNRGHNPNQEPDPLGWEDHVHDYKPNPFNPSGRGDRQKPRKPKPNEKLKDFPTSD